MPKGINYAGYIGHSALRTYVMGERAFADAPSADELAAMCRLAKEAVQAGAIGFSTSRTVNHLTADDRPVASRAAPWDEVRAIVNAVGETGRGVFEIAHEAVGRDPERLREYHHRLRDLAVESGVPQTWGMFSSRFAPDHWRGFVDLVDETAAAGGRMFVQVHSRALNVLMSFKTQLPFDKWDVWRDLRALPLQEQQAKLRDPALRAQLVQAAHGKPPAGKIVGVEARPPDYDHFYVMDSMSGDDRLLRDLAAERGMDPVELMIELGLQTNFGQFFRQPAANENQADVLEMIRHPRSVVTFSDSGAHVSQIMDSSLQTHLLGHWVREKQALSLEDAVRQLSYNTATQWGMHDRGLVRVGMNADLAVFDPDTVGPEMPRGGKRPAGRRHALKAGGEGHQEHHRQRRGILGKQRPHGGAGRAAVPRRGVRRCASRTRLESPRHWNTQVFVVNPLPIALPDHRGKLHDRRIGSVASELVPKVVANQNARILAHVKPTIGERPTVVLATAVRIVR